MSSKDLQNEMMELEMVMEENPGELSSQNPVVLSCGGIYIPRENKFGRPVKSLYQVLNTCNERSPIKIVVENIYKDILSEFMKKESMN
ncbi:hypothetical protein KKA47_02145 [bacterium]|nr:hypothetical protein [bacterium]